MTDDTRGGTTISAFTAGQLAAQSSVDLAPGDSFTPTYTGSLTFTVFQMT